MKKLIRIKNIWKKANMSLKCASQDCEEIAFFNNKRLKIPLYCEKHKSKYMVDVTIRCIEEKCHLVSSFNYTHEEKPLYCGKHFLPGMVSKTKLGEEYPKRCIYKNCKELAFYNYSQYENRLYCHRHMKKDMIFIELNICIGFYKCNKRPFFRDMGDEDKRAKYCVDHKSADMVFATEEDNFYREWDLISGLDTRYQEEDFSYYTSNISDIYSGNKTCKYFNCRRIIRNSNMKINDYCLFHKQLEDVHNSKLETFCKNDLCISKTVSVNGYCIFCNIFDFYV